MDDLVRWLGEQLDEDERTARAAANLQADPENGWGAREGAITPHIGVVHEEEAQRHIVAWNPARVLREIDAKRRILTAYENHDQDAPELDVPYSVIQLLALPYQDRPGYREQWRP